MSNSLKDQLLALGLAPKKTSPKPKKQHKPRPEAEKSGSGGSEISLDQAYRIRSKEERLQKEKAIELKREQERKRRETNQKIKAMVKEAAIRDPAAENKRNFLYKGRIRSVLATRKQIEEINKGTIGIVYLSGNYHLMFRIFFLPRIYFVAVFGRHPSIFLKVLVHLLDKRRGGYDY